MRTHRGRVLFLMFFLLTCLGEASLLAQEIADWRSWTSVCINYKMSKTLRLRTKLEYRTKNNLQSSDRWNANIGLHYSILPFLEVKGSYELHHRDLGSDGWRFRHRFNVGAQAAWKFGNLKLSYRERFQETVQGRDTESMLRSRIKLDYSIPRTCLQPYFSTELFQRMDGFPDVNIIRYRPGLKIGISERCAVVAFYCRQYEKHRKLNIAGLDMELYF